MRIHKLHFQHFRGFSDSKFEFPERVTVLIGDNGTGKTALLDGLAVAAGALFLGLKATPSRTIHDQDVRRETFDKPGGRFVEKQYPCSISCEGIVAGSRIGWRRTLAAPHRLTDRIGARELSELGARLGRQVSSGANVALPLIAYYGTGRLWPHQTTSGWRPLPPGSRLTGYDYCFDPVANLDHLLRWFQTREVEALQFPKRAAVLKTIKKCIAACVEGWRDIYFDLGHKELLAVLADGRSLPFGLLSDGVRNMVAMVMDIAQRAVRLNPHLGARAPRQTPGIVMIDEIDLHLHPRWQRRIVGSLREVFPKLQFVATTHSPFIIQSLRPGELIDLNAAPSGEYYHKSIEDIAENVMRVELPQRSERYQRMMAAAETYYSLLRSARRKSKRQLARLKAELDELAAPFSDDPAYQAFLRMERLAAGFGEKRG